MSSVGVIAKNHAGELVFRISQAIGKATNNEAEYQSLIIGLKNVLSHSSGGALPTLRIYMDSQLVVKQIRREYKIKEERLKLLAEEVRNLLAPFPLFSIEHIPRERNKEADRAANDALDS